MSKNRPAPFVKSDERPHHCCCECVHYTATDGSKQYCSVKGDLIDPSQRTCLHGSLRHDA